jgi:hypothetical protein
MYVLSYSEVFRCVKMNCLGFHLTAALIVDCSVRSLQAAL